MTSSMTSSAEATSLEAVECRLHKLIALGFQFAHPTDNMGAVVEILGVRVHDTVVDVVKLQGENEVLAMRIPGDEVDILSPARTLWQSSGFVCDVLDELLALPDEAGSDVTSARIGGVWLPGRPGTAKWVTASS